MRVVCCVSSVYLLALGFMSLAAALAPYGMHVARASSPLRLRGGTDIKWTPGDDKPNAPFSKRARDEQARREGRDPDAPPPEDWSLARVVSEIANAIASHPKETAYVVMGAAAAYSVSRFRQKLRQDWPVIVSSSSPLVTVLQPRGRYLKNTLTPLVRALELSTPRGEPMTLPAKTGAKAALDAPKGYSIFRHRAQVGCGVEDLLEACNALKAWRMADAVEGLSAIVTRKGVGGGTGGVGDTVVLVQRTRAGYVCEPWRVIECDQLPEDLVALTAGTEEGTKAEVGEVEEVEEGAGGRAEEVTGKGKAEEVKQVQRHKGGVSWSMVCGALNGCSMDGQIRFSVELDEGADAQVWLEVLAVTKRAQRASMVLHPMLTKMLRTALHEMADKLQGIVEVQKDMRFARQRRAAHVQASNDEARAEYMVKKVLEQQDKLNLKPNQWKRGNIVDKQAFDPRG